MRRTLWFSWLLLFLWVGHTTAQTSRDVVFPLATRAMRVLAEAQNAETPTSRLIALLQEGNPSVQVAAVRNLLARDASEAVPVLQKVAEAASSEAQAAARVGIVRRNTRQEPPDKQVEALLPLLTEPNATQELRLEVLEALGEIKSPVVTKTLLEFAGRHRDNKPLHVRALVALANVGAKEILPSLEAWVVRSYEPPPHIHAPRPDGLSDEQREALRRAYWTVRIAGLPQEEALRALEGGLRKGPASEVVIEILASMGEPGLAVLRQAAQAKQWPTGNQSLIIRQLGLATDNKAQDLLLEIYQDRAKGDYTRGFALGALVRVQHPRAAEFVFRIIESPAQEGLHERWSIYALWRLLDLHQIGVERAKLEELLWTFLSASPPRSDVAVQALRAVGSPRSVPHLIALLRDKSRIHAHLTALTTIGFIGDNSPQTLSFLFDEIVPHENRHKRALAAGALARIGDPVAIPVLLAQARQEKDPHAFWYQVSALCALGERNERVRKQVVEALETMKAQKVDPYFQEPVDEALLRLQREPNVL